MEILRTSTGLSGLQTTAPKIEEFAGAATMLSIHGRLVAMV